MSELTKTTREPWRLRPRTTLIGIVVLAGVAWFAWSRGSGEAPLTPERLTPSPTSTASSANETATPVAGAAATAPDGSGTAGIGPAAAEEGIYHVRPGMDIQAALELAAADPVNKTVRVHAGVYRPRAHGQAMIFFNQRHDGITLEAEGEVVLTSANPEIADPAVASYPCVVNHTVYFGDGISRKTVLRGFKITGANYYITQAESPIPIQPPVDHPKLQERDLVYYTDGGGIKIWGRSYPWIDRVEIYDNFANPCAAAISVDLRGFTNEMPLITNSIFRNNRTQFTGSAIDLFGAGNAAEIRNCLFVGNIANRGINCFAFPREGFHERHGSGALTVFGGSRVTVDRCTFTGNYNGVDDDSNGSVYTNCIFWKNDLPGGIAPGERYELDIRDGSGVSNCWLGGGTISDLRKSIPADRNVLDAPDPQFDGEFRPTASEYKDVGYRPIEG
jgi:hypothetical protein